MEALKIECWIYFKQENSVTNLSYAENAEIIIL